MAKLPRGASVACLDAHGAGVLMGINRGAQRASGENRKHGNASANIVRHEHDSALRHRCSYGLDLQPSELTVFKSGQTAVGRVDGECADGAVSAVKIRNFVDRIEILSRRMNADP